MGQGRKFAKLLLLLALLVFGQAQEGAAARVARALEPVLDALPRSVVNLQLELSNHSQVSSWRVEPDLALPRGWSLLAPAGTVELAPGESMVLVLPVLVSATARPGTYTFPVRLGGSGGDPELIFDVRVPSVQRIELVALPGEQLIVGPEHRARFLISNVGNTRLEPQLTAASGLGYRVEVEPRTLELAAGESAEVMVVAQVTEQSTSPRPHALTLTVQLPGVDTPLGVARSIAQLVPRSLPERSAFHTFPIELRLALPLASGAGPTGVAGASPTIGLSGGGKLAPGGEEELAFALEWSLAGGIEELELTYLRPGMELSLGEHQPIFSKLASVPNGYGVRLRQSWQDSVGWRGEGMVGLYMLAGDPAVELAASGGRGEVALGWSLLSSREEQDVSISASYAPTVSDPSLPRLSGLEGSYGVRFRQGQGAPGHGLELNLRFSEGPSTASLSLRSTTADFTSAGFHNSTFVAAANLRLNEALRLAPLHPLNLQLEYAEEWTWPDDLPLGEVLAGDPPDVASRFSVGASLGVGSGAISATYRYRDRLRTADAWQEKQTTLGLRVGLPGNASLESELGWEERRHASGELHEAVRYQARAAVPALGGSIKAGLDALFLPASGDLSRLIIDADWSGRLHERLEFGAEAKLDLLGRTEWGRLELRSEVALAQAHSLDLEVLAKLYRGRTPDFAVGLAYSMPLALPLSRLPDIGELRGTIHFHTGEPVSGLLVSLGELLTTVRPDGTFVFPAVPAGTHLLDLPPASRRLAPTQIVLPVLPLEVTIFDGERTSVELQVVEGAAVIGRLEVASAAAAPEPGSAPGGGSPAPFAGVRLEMRGNSAVLHAVTAADGSFSFRHLAPGEWTLRVVDRRQGATYRYELDDESFILSSGETRQVLVRVVPIARRFDFVEGGVLEVEGAESDTETPLQDDRDDGAGGN